MGWLNFQKGKNMKAKYIGSYIFQNRKYLEYEYRKQKYSVCADWNAEQLSWQHKSEQALIDRMLDQKCMATENAQIGFDKLWNYFETGNWE